MSDIPFNRIVIPSEGGRPGKAFAEFLRIDEDSEISLAELQSFLYDRMYRLGMVRHVDGTRAHRRRARDRRNAKQRHAKVAYSVKAKAKSSSRSKKKNSKSRRGRGRAKAAV